MPVFFQSRFMRHVFTLFSGAALSQIIGILISPFLSRLYTPYDFGLFALYSSFLTISSIVAAGRYDSAILLPSEDQDAFLLVMISLGLILLSMTGLQIILFLLSFNPLLNQILSQKQLSEIILYLPLSVVSLLVFQIGCSWLNRKKLYQAISIVRLFQSILLLGSNLLLGILKMGVYGLVLSTLISQTLGVCSILYILYTHRHLGRFHLSWKALRQTARTYKSFPQVNLLQGLADAFQANFFIFLLEAYFGTALLGAYSFSRRMFNALLTPIISSVTQVLFQQASETYTKGQDLHLFSKRILITSGILAIGGTLLAVGLAPTIFGLVFGKEWESAGLVSRYIAPWIFFASVSSLVGFIPAIVNEQKMDLLLATFGNLITLLLLHIGYRYLQFNPYQTFLLVSCFQVVFHSSCFFWTLHISKKKSAYIL